MELTFNLHGAKGESLDAIAKIIQLRTRQLGETTAESCKAVAINILKSIRANTKVANEKIKNITVTESDNKYFPSWKRVGKKNVRILRSGQNGNEV